MRNHRVDDRDGALPPSRARRVRCARSTHGRPAICQCQASWLGSATASGLSKRQAAQGFASLGRHCPLHPVANRPKDQVAWLPHRNRAVRDWRIEPSASCRWVRPICAPPPAYVPDVRSACTSRSRHRSCAGSGICDHHRPTCADTLMQRTPGSGVRPVQPQALRSVNQCIGSRFSALHARTLDAASMGQRSAPLTNERTRSNDRYCRHRPAAAAPM